MGDIRDHANAVIAAVAAGGVTVYKPDEVPGIGEETNDDTLPEPDPPYAIVHADLGRGDGERYSGDQSMKIFRISFVLVGRNWDEAAWEAEKIEAALKGVRFTINGRRGTKLKLESSKAPDPDNNDSRIHTGTVVYSHAIPA